MIKSFRHKGLKRFFETNERRGVAPALVNRLRRQSDVLNRARTAADMNLPGYRLHRLKGNRAQTWSVQLAEIGESRLNSRVRMLSTLTSKIIIKGLNDAEQLAKQPQKTTDTSG